MADVESKPEKSKTKGIVLIWCAVQCGQLDVIFFQAEDYLKQTDEVCEKSDSPRLSFASRCSSRVWCVLT